jgi:hypothetical protein
MRLSVLLLSLCLLLLGCGQPSLFEPALPVIDPVSGEAYIAEPLTLYNAYFGLWVNLPADTRLHELENLGLTEQDYADPDLLTQTDYGQTSVYSLFDLTLDRGGEPNYCRVIGAVEQMEGVESLEDFAAVFSHRMGLSSADEDYQIIFESSETTTIAEEDYIRMTFSEVEPDQPLYRYEAYLRPLPAMENAFLTLVLFYDTEASSGAGQAVGQHYIETGIGRLPPV